MNEQKPIIYSLRESMIGNESINKKTKTVIIKSSKQTICGQIKEYIYIILICITVIEQGIGTVKLFILLIVSRDFIDFHPGSLLATVESFGVN